MTTDKTALDADEPILHNSLLYKMAETIASEAKAIPSNIESGVGDCYYKIGIQLGIKYALNLLFKQGMLELPDTRPQPSGDAVNGKDYKKLYWDLLESWSDLKIKHGVLQEKLEAALTQPKADVDTLMKDVYAAYENDDDSHKKSTVAWVIDHLAAQGYIGGGWKDISTIPDNLMSGVDLWDDREEKRYINCTFDLRVQAWADERSDFVKIPTHWMPLPAAPKKEGVNDTSI